MLHITRFNCWIKGNLSRFVISMLRVITIIFYGGIYGTYSLVPHGYSTSSWCFVRAFYLLLQSFLTSHMGGGGISPWLSNLVRRDRIFVLSSLDEVKILFLRHRVSKTLISTNSHARQYAYKWNKTLERLDDATNRQSTSNAST